MTLYATGTLGLTNGSATVTGAGTAWVGAIRPGWIILIPGEPTLLVQSVNAAGSLTLARPYQGTTRTGVAYNAVATRGELATFLTQLQTVLAAMQGTIDGAGQGRFEDGTVAAPGVRFTADQDTGMRRKGANALAMVAGGVDRLEVNSTGAVVTGLLSGTAVIQSAVDGTQGRLLTVGAFGLATSAGVAAPADLNDIAAAGTYGFTNVALNRPFAFGTVTHAVRSSGRATQMAIESAASGAPFSIAWRSQTSDGWSPWRLGFSASNILGTVSQAAGVPTGAVIERGANANGDYVRFADGTQICTRTIIASAGAATSWVFPAAFAVVPVVTGTAVATVLAAVCLDGAPIVTSAGFSVRDKTDARRADTCHMIARGRWF